MTKIDAVNSAMAKAPYFALSPEALRALRQEAQASNSKSDDKPDPDQA